MQIHKPIIGVIPDYKDGTQADGYSIRPHYAIRCNYVEMLAQAGAVALILPYDYNAIDEYLSIIDGLMVIGGHFDVHPKRYNVQEIHPTVTLNETRENFEFEITKKVLTSTLPILGICNGMQLINILHGGDIIQHIPDDAKYIAHEQSKVKGQEDSAKAYHDVDVVTGSILHKITQKSTIPTNSSHHQGVKTVPSTLRISGRTKDGMIEAIENPVHPFCLGVQWHPEFNVSGADKAIFESFVDAAKNYRIKHSL